VGLSIVKKANQASAHSGDVEEIGVGWRITEAPRMADRRAGPGAIRLMRSSAAGNAALHRLGDLKSRNRWRGFVWIDRRDRKRNLVAIANMCSHGTAALPEALLPPQADPIGSWMAIGCSDALSRPGRAGRSVPWADNPACR
jgi:hypothetical protein